MNKKIKNNTARIYSYFNKKVLNYYCKVLKDKPKKATGKFLSKLILYNSKIDKANSKFFLRSDTKHLCDSYDDEDFFMAAMVIFMIIFIL